MEVFDLKEIFIKQLIGIGREMRVSFHGISFIVELNNLRKLFDSYLQ